jgi:hypothetical protein
VLLFKMNDDDNVLMVLETTNAAKFKNRTPKALRLLAFLEAKKGHGQELNTGNSLLMNVLTFASCQSYSLLSL